MAEAHQHPVSTPFSVPQTPFARLCQAALLASRVSASHARRRKKMPDFRLDEVTRLIDEHVAFIQALDTISPTSASSPASDRAMESTKAEELSILAPRSVAWSSLCVLCEAYCGPEGVLDGASGFSWSTDEVTPSSLTPEQLRLYAVTDKMMEDVASESAVTIANLIGCSGAVDWAVAGPETVLQLGRISPLVMDILYRALGIFHCTAREEGSSVVGPNIQRAVDCLTIFARRWGLAGEYLTLEKFHVSSCPALPAYM
jgi:hypothetical protein